MAKKKQEIKEISYRALTGFDIDATGQRFEAGELIADGVLSESALAALFEMNAIELTGEGEENGLS
jgi:tryptophan synthase alpha subunit